MNNLRTILITGATSGIGHETAGLLKAKGHLVLGTSRKAGFPGELKRNIVNLIPLDLNQPQSVDRLFDYIKLQETYLDVVFCNAGIGFAGAVESTPLSSGRQVMETNFWGNLNVIQQAMNIFRLQNHGHLIVTSSLAGIFSLPFQGYYSAGKFALEAMLESLYMEINNPKISISILQPGDLKTNFTNARMVIRPISSIMKTRFETALGKMVKDEQEGTHAKDVARKVASIILKKRPKLRYTIGRGSLMATLLYKLLPDWAFFQILKKHYE